MRRILCQLSSKVSSNLVRQRKHHLFGQKVLRMNLVKHYSCENDGSALAAAIIDKAAASTEGHINDIDLVGACEFHTGGRPGMSYSHPLVRQDRSHASHSGGAWSPSLGSTKSL